MNHIITLTSDDLPLDLPTGPRMTFYDWLLEQVERRDPVGDLVTMILSDPPVGMNLVLATLNTWGRYIWQRYHSQHIRRSFLDAAYEYFEQMAYDPASADITEDRNE